MVERRGRREHRPYWVKKYQRITRDRRKLLNALLFMLLIVLLFVFGYEFMFTPGSFSDE